MSRSSNSLKASDVAATPIKLKYTASIASDSLESYGIKVMTGVNNPISLVGGDSQETLNYASIKHLFYSNYLTGSFPVSSSAAFNWEQSTAAFGTLDADIRTLPTGSGELISVISIPRSVYGEKISRKSFALYGPDCYITDDGNGNLVDIGSNGEYVDPNYYTPQGSFTTGYVTGPSRDVHVGNIIYAQGLAIITNQDYIVEESIQIGDQTWMPRNLDVDTYRNGDPIPQVTDPIEWANLTTGAWCYYDNDPANEAIYGKLYNGHAVNDPRGLAPAGWRIPSTTDWGILANYLGGWQVAGDALKEAGIAHWLSGNAGTNSSGFTALGAGGRYYTGNFYSLNYWGYWWSSTEYNYQSNWVWGIYSNNSSFYEFGQYNTFGLSVRCVKDTSSLINSSYTIGLTAETTIYQNEVKCRINENDFNFSQNPTISTGVDTDAHATLTIGGLGNSGDKIEVFVNDPVFGSISIGAYYLQAGDTTTSIIAANLAAAITANTYGYIAASSGNLVVITARSGLGASINGGGRLSVVFTSDLTVHIFDDTFDYTFD